MKCQETGIDFAITESDKKYYDYIQVPYPTFCPESRFKRRLSWINVTKFYKRKDGLISMYRDNCGYNIIPDYDWWSDKYDCLEHGREYDFSKNFFSQFNDLLHTARLPHLHRNYSTFENSDYCNAASNLKNCYMVSCADNVEDCYYSVMIENCKSCSDLLLCNHCELCYDCINCRKCYFCFYSYDCQNSSYLQFSEDCIGCHNCFGCIGLRNKEYCIYNQQYTPEDYASKTKDLLPNSYQEVAETKKQIAKFFSQFPQKQIRGHQNENVSGNYIYQSKNVHNSYVAEKCEDSKYVQFIRYLDAPSYNCMDYTIFGIASSSIYESAWCGLHCHNVKFSYWCYNCSDIEYCYGCHNSQNLFGCVGLRSKQYCIFNKQYTENDYHQKVKEIKEQMLKIPYTDKNGLTYFYGEFFPSELSPFFPEETLLSDFYLANDLETNLQYSPTNQIAEEQTCYISEMPDSVVNKLLFCLKTNKPYKITSQELKFYKNNNIPLPNHCFNYRNKSRIKQLSKPF
jgi:hypothetical protein